ncbi:MAG: molybdenum cofactor sulfurase [Rhizobiaceae bacterium]|nr:molybdenum cofactor sulfurase [Rhizobiaceae bacterium]
MAISLQPHAGMRTVPGRKLAGRLDGLYVAEADHFVTRAADRLDLTFDGIAGDHHSGPTRRSSSREPWYPRNTVIRNERQLSIVSPEEMTQVAMAMELPELKPEWIGANLSIAGVPALSMLPAGSLLFFEGGVTVKVDAQNAPCRIAGRSIAEHAGVADKDAVSLLFPKVAKRQRGLVAWVEKPGRLTKGEGVSLKIPEQWIYDV